MIVSRAREGDDIRRFMKFLMSTSYSSIIVMYTIYLAFHLRHESEYTVIMATLKKIWVSPKYPRFFKTCLEKANVASILRAWDEPPHFLFSHSSERRARARLLSYYHHHAWADDENEEKFILKLASLFSLTLTWWSVSISHPTTHNDIQLFNLLTKLYRTSKEFFALSLFSVKWGKKLNFFFAPHPWAE